MIGREADKYIHTLSVDRYYPGVRFRSPPPMSQLLCDIFLYFLINFFNMSSHGEISNKYQANKCHNRTKRGCETFPLYKTAVLLFHQ